MQKTLLALALMLPLSCFAAKASDASKPEVASPFTAERNKAAGNLSTSLVVMQKMAKNCKIEQTEGLINSATKGYIERNKAYLGMHYGYVTAFLDYVKDTAGADEAKKISGELLKANNDQSNKIIEDMTKKDGPTKACQRYFTYLAAGEMDIKKGSPDFKTLNDMLNFANSQKVK